MMLTSHRRHVAGTASILAVSALALAACSSGSSGAGDPAEAWALTGQQTTIENSFSSYNADHPDQKVNVEFFENDAYKQRIRTAIGSGDAPTLIWSWGGGPVRAYVDSGRLAPLDESLAEGIFPAIADNGRVDGDLYAVPNNTVQPVVMYFNEDVLAEAGIDGHPQTWDELLEAVAALRDAGLSPISMGGASKWPQLMWLEYLTDRIGGPEVFDAIQDGEADAWSDPAVIEALTKIQELVDAGGFADGWESLETDNGADAALVYSGRAGMILQGAWLYADFLSAVPDMVGDGTITWGAFPTVEGGLGDPSAVVGNASNYWSISSDASEEQQAAAASYLADGNLSDDYIDGLLAGGGVPPVEGLEDRIAQTDGADFLLDIYERTQTASSFTLSWDQAIDPADANDMLTYLDQVFLGQISPEEFAASMNETLD